MTTSHGHDARGKFDMTQSDQTWTGFLRLAKWTIIVSLVVLIGMAFFLTGGQPTH